MGKRYLNDHGMELLTKYLKERGCQYDDVMIEVIDHYAILIEEHLNTSRDHDFDMALKIVHKKLGGARVLRKTVRSKQKQLQKYWNNRVRQFMYSYLTWPKMLMTICILLSLFSIALWVNSNKQAVIIIFIIEIIIAIASYFVINRSVKQSSYDWSDLHGRLWTFDCFMQAGSVALILFIPINIQQLILNFWKEEVWALPLVLAIGIVASTYFILKAHAFHTEFRHWIKEELQSKFPEHLELIKF